MKVITLPTKTVAPKNIPFQRPVELTCFSIDANRKVHFDDRELKYYYPPTFTDLKGGYPEKFIQKDETNPEYLDVLLQVLQKNSLPEEPVDFITWRGLITKICLAPFNNNEEWSLLACKHKNTIYIAEHEKKKEGTCDRQRRMMYWGYKFENLSTVAVHPSKVTHSHLEERVNSVVNNNCQYGIVSKTKLGRHSLIMGAEVDCTSDYKVDNDPGRYYCELKTSKIISNSKDLFSFEKYKLVKFYFQSFLVAVSKIIVGFRDDNGFIKEIKEYETLKIPRMVRDKGYWDPNTGLTFCDILLQQLRETIDKDLVTFKIEMKHPFECVTIKESPEISSSLIVPEWFTA